MQIQTQISNLFLVKSPCRTPRKQASLAALCDFQLFPVKTYLFTDPQQQVNQVLQPLKKLILVFCLTVGLADVPLKVTAELLPGGPFLYLTAPVGFAFLYHILSRAGVQPKAQRRQVCESVCLLLKLCLHLFTKKI